MSCGWPHSPPHPGILKGKGSGPLLLVCVHPIYKEPTHILTLNQLALLFIVQIRLYTSIFDMNIIIL